MSDVFGDRLKKVREVRGFSQVKLALLAKIPATSISHFEAGSRNPSFSTLIRLADSLEVSTDFFFALTEKIPERRVEERNETFQRYIDKTILWFSRGYTHPITIHLPVNLHSKLLKELSEGFNINFEENKFKPFTYSDVKFVLSSGQGMVVDVEDFIVPGED
jgi:transcriptional regulator with XRE-family HTH domain